VRLYEVGAQGPPPSAPVRTTAEATAASVPAPARPPPSRRRRGLALGALAAAVVVAGVVAVVLLTMDGDEGTATAKDPRVALVLPGPPGRETDALLAPVYDGLREAARELGARTTKVVSDETPADPPTPAEINRATARLARGHFDLVIVPDANLSEQLVPAIHELRSTRFALLDNPHGWQQHLGRLTNATGFAFADRDAGYLAGYLSGLMERRGGPRLNGKRIVSVVGGPEGVPSVDALVAGFAAGARRAFPGVTVLTAFSGDFGDQRRCQRIASRQIDAGSDVVFAPAGGCGFGALREAGIRGVWGVGADSDRSCLGPHILASAVKRFDRAALLAIRSLVEGTLPAGGTVGLGLGDDAVGLAGLSDRVPASVKKAVAALADRLRRSEP
jgi:basic membrane protein A and related proteins